MDEGNALLSIPPSFTTSAGKLGWNHLNHKISATSVVLMQGDYRLSFIKKGEEKFWLLHRYNSENGWHLVHEMSHPGTTRLDWVLKTCHQIMSGHDAQTSKPSKPAARRSRAQTKKS
tara:strand:+ start:1757 stop:2107 length:351 start_codon:yes stop_codon:yes gene_type:complete